MYANILVGVDGGPGGRDAIALARELRDARGFITLAYVLTGSAPVGVVSTSAFEATEREHAGEMLERERARDDLEADKAVTGSGTAGEGLHHLAESRGADLVVVGSTRHGAISRLLIGDDAWDALNRASTTVAVAPAGYASRPHAFAEVGVAYDASSEAEDALDLGRRLAAEYGAKLSAMEVAWKPAFGHAPSATKPAGPQRLEEATREVSGLEGVEPHAAYGHVADELAVYSASVDLLVVGSPGHGANRLAHGSVARRLARITRCPLLVPPHSAPAEDRSG